MGMLALNRLVSMKREDRRWHHQIQVRDGSLGSLGKTKCSPHQDDNSHGGQTRKDSVPDLPEDIWRHIHSLVPMQDAARAACVSHAFLRFWRCYPNLTFSKKMLGLNSNVCGNEEEFTGKVDQILKNHSGIGLKKFKLEFDDHNANDCYFLNSWLQIAATPEIEDLSLVVSSDKATYNFPCSLLSHRIGDSIRYLHLFGCAFRPTVRFSCLNNLTTLHLYCVRIKENELACLLSSSFALEQLELRYCDEIACLHIPHILQRLSYLQVFQCCSLRAIENKAPNISNLHFVGTQVQLSLVESLQLKSLKISHSCALYYSRATLPAIMPNLETVVLDSFLEMVNTPMIHSKFLHLKHLSIYLGRCAFSPTYDYFSLVSFLDASPSLETFFLRAPVQHLEHESIFGDPSHLRRMPEHHYDKIKSVKIIGFSSAKRLVELTIHILESATSLECLTLDTTYCPFRCSDSKTGKCFPLGKNYLMEAPKALLAIRTYIEGRVPTTVKLDVLEPCNRCHAFEF